MVSSEKKRKKAFIYKLGIGLIVLSLSLWLVLSVKAKAGIITGSLIVAEVMFWIGAVLVGKEIAAKFKGYLNPANWGKKGGARKHDK